MFDDRVEFVSLGGLAPGVTLNDIMFGVSISRNENLANVFYRLGLIEAYGTGIPKMLRSYADFPGEPTIETSDNAFKITLPNKNHPGGRAVIPNATAQPDERELAVLALFEKKNLIVRTDIEQYLGVSQGTATRIIRKMLETGLLKSNGRGKHTRYSQNSVR